MDEKNQPTEKKFSLRNFLSLGEVGGYFFRRKDLTRPLNVNIRVMHGINKISIIVFILAILFFLAKRFLM